MAAFTKSAQVPFQSWLLGAMVAPTPVSALLHSSTMVKLGVYLIIRMAPAIHQYPWLALMIAVVGGYSFVSTALLAIQERRMKRLLAFSTIGNLGLIIMLAAIGTPESIAAAVILTLFHAISKALLFLSAGTVQKVFDRKDIEGTEGLFRRAPSMFGAFFIGMLTMFLAPFGVFIAKYTAITESASNPFLVIMVVIGSIACEVFYVRWLGRTMALTGKPVEKKISPIMTYPMWTLAIGAIVLSVFLPFFMASLVNPIVSTAPGLKASEMFIFIQLNYIGFIPTFLLFVALLFIVGYGTQQTDVRKVEPYVGGMYDYTVELACPYFDKYIPSEESLMKAEVVGLCVMVSTLVVALWAGGMF
jgi:ech hydrogenase subunit A